MIRASLFRTLLLGVALVMLGLSPEPALAQRGHGGGGFHGGGFHGGGYHGGGYHGGYHGGGYHGGSGWGGYHGGGWGYHGGGYRGGWGGYHRGWNGYGWGGGWGGWGCCGWGFGVSFNFGYGGGWGYPVYVPYYAYPPYAYYPYPYYYYAPTSAPAYPYAPTSAPPADPGYGGGNVEYQQPASLPSTDSSAELVKVYEANYGSRPAAQSTYRVTSAVNVRRLPAMRPEVQNVIRALRGMPPQAAERALDSGRYGNLSAHELQVVREAAGLGR